MKRYNGGSGRPQTGSPCSAFSSIGQPEYGYLQGKEICRGQYRKPITLSEVASIAFISPSYLSALFKKETGKSLVEYINECKVEKAKEMFDTESTSVDETAPAPGFENIYYFSKVLR